MRRIKFILKDGISNQQVLEEQLSAFSKDPKFKVEWEFTKYAGHATELAKSAALTKTTIVVAVGGDGTINEVVNGLVLLGEAAKDRPILAVLPSGTANDFSKSFKTANDLAALINKIKKNKTQLVDLGKVSFTNLNNEATNRYFINVADIGLGGDVVRRVNSSSKLLSPKLLFLKAITQSMLFYKKRNVICTSDNGVAYQGKAMTIVAANGRYFGEGLCIAPKAKLDSGKLDLVVLGDITIWDYVKNLGTVRAGKLIKHPQVSYSASAKIVVVNSEASSNSPAPLEMDGEFVGFAPVIFEAVPGAIRLLK